jgi:hypothetical protein
MYTYVFKKCMYLLLSGHGGVESTFASQQLQLELVTKCLTHNVCDLLVRALGRFSQDECVSAASYMALSVLLSIGKRHISFVIQKVLARQLSTSPSFNTSIMEDPSEVL